MHDEDIVTFRKIFREELRSLLDPPPVHVNHVQDLPVV